MTKISRLPGSRGPRGPQKPLKRPNVSQLLEVVRNRATKVGGLAKLSVVYNPRATLDQMKAQIDREPNMAITEIVTREIFRRELFRPVDLLNYARSEDFRERLIAARYPRIDLYLLSELMQDKVECVAVMAESVMMERNCENLVGDELASKIPKDLWGLMTALRETSDEHTALMLADGLYLAIVKK